MVTQQDDQSDCSKQKGYCSGDQEITCKPGYTEDQGDNSDMEEPPFIVLRTSGNETLQSKKRKTARERKCSVISKSLHRSKSLPDRLHKEGLTSEKANAEERLRCKLTDIRSAEQEAELFAIKRQKLCRMSSCAQVEYAQIRAAIKCNNRFDLLSVLNRKHDDINTLGADGFAALHHAAVIGTRKVVDMLLCFGAKTNLKNLDGDYPLDLAVRAGNYDLAKYLIEKGACVDNIVNGTPPMKHKQRKMERSHTISTG